MNNKLNQRRPRLIAGAVMLMAALTGFAPLTAVAGPVVSGFDANTLPANDDGSAAATSLGFGFNFYGTTYTQTYVNNNGNLTFNGPLSTFTPFGLTGNIGTPIIAPFFADVDTRGAGSGLVSYGTGTFGGHTAFGANWPNVGYFGSHTDKLNNFQVILVDRSDTGIGNVDIYFNYDSIQWETGDASGGTNGLGGSSARVGYSNGTGNPGTFYEFPGSGTNGAFLNGGPDSLIAGTNVGTPGRFLFQVRDGNIAPPPNGVPDPATFALLCIGLAGLGWSTRRTLHRS